MLISWLIESLLYSDQSPLYSAQSSLYNALSLPSTVLQSPLYSAQSPLYSAHINMSNPTGIADPNSSWSFSTIDKAVHTMIPNTSTQSQDLFKDCLGFARQLSQSPGVYCELEVNLGENSFKFMNGSPGKFPGKRKSPSDYRRDQRRKKPQGKGILTPSNHRGFGCQRANFEIFHRCITPMYSYPFY